jgi:hypothetical protein
MVRRARLWDLDDKLHCPIIGTCVSIEELQRFARRFQFASPSDDDFTVHVEAVGLARSRNPASEALQRHLEKKVPSGSRALRQTQERCRSPSAVD